MALVQRNHKNLTLPKRCCGLRRGEIALFHLKRHIIWAIALPMAVCNALGGLVGSRLAIRRGNKFIRLLFIFVLVLAIGRFGYEVVKGYV